MNIEQFKATLPTLMPDVDIAILQARVKKVSHPGKRDCQRCCFCKQEAICAELIDHCDGIQYELIKFRST